MKMSGTSEGADLAVAEAAGNWKLWKDIASNADIAIGAAEQAVASAQAGEQDSHERCGIAALIVPGLQQLAGIQS